MENSEDSSLVLNIRSVKNKEKYEKNSKTKKYFPQKPAFVMKNLVVAHIIMYPLCLLYVTVFYTLFLMAYRKCHYKGLNLPLICFIVSDVLFIVAGILNFISMINRVLKVFGWALKVITVSLIMKIVGVWSFIGNDDQECFKKRSVIMKLSMVSVVIWSIYWAFLYYLYAKINKKPWKEVFLSVNKF